ncbi:hypothetical protein J2Y41_000947 [Arthrobacter sp. 1088]|nr:hypothetical protein [Arthrobacter sp. 1088]
MSTPERRHLARWGRREQAQLNGLRIAIGSAGIDAAELWLRYFGIGGTAGEYEVNTYLQPLTSLPPWSGTSLPKQPTNSSTNFPPGPAPLHRRGRRGRSPGGRDPGGRLESP